MKNIYGIKKRVISVFMIAAMALTFVFSYGVGTGSVYAASKSKTYALPSSIDIEYYDGSMSKLDKIKYDKYGNVKSLVWLDSIRLTFKNKYRNKKGDLASVRISDTDDGAVYVSKTYNKKGHLTKVKLGDATCKYTTNKKGIITKATRHGKKMYSVKNVKYHKNGFVSKVVYSNGNVKYYNKDGLLTKETGKKGSTYTYKYTKKNGKVVKVVGKRNGKNYFKATFKYGKSTTKDVWKYSCAIGYAEGSASKACEIYANCAVSGENWL